jgi:ribosomal-protein-alanine N-acetyltransferase
MKTTWPSCSTGNAAAVTTWSPSTAAEPLWALLSLVADGGTVDVGLGLRPDLTGRGLGAGFLEEVLAETRSRHAPERVTLSVAAFNERAIVVYERAGFAEVARRRHATNGGVHEFVDMAREMG